MNCRSATSEEELWSNGMSAPGNPERSVSFFVLNVLFSLGATVMLAIVPVYLSWSLLGLIWSAGVLWSHRCLRPRPVNKGDVMIRWGHPPRHTTIRAYQLYFSAALGNIFVIILALSAIAFPSPPTATEPLPTVIERLLATLQGITRWGIAFLALAFLIAAILSAYSTLSEIRNSETAYASAKEYDTLLAAKSGHVVLGHEFKRAVHVSVSSATRNSSIEPLAGEVVAHTLERWVGRNQPFILDVEEEPNQHLMIFGPAGSGKTETVKALIVRYWLAKRVPFMILDWTGEFVSFVHELGGTVWTVPSTFLINPLRLGGYSPRDRVNELIESLTATADLTDLQASEVGNVLEQAYKEHGILDEDASTWTRKPPIWADLIDILEARYRSGYYEDQGQQSIYWTLRKLMRSNIRQVFGDEVGEFFDTVLKVPTVIDLSGLKGQDVAKSLVTYLVFQRLRQAFETLGLSRLRLFVILEEAHLVLKTEEKKSRLVGEPLPVKLIRMGRKYGFAIVVSTQLATDVSKEAAGNPSIIIALKFTHPQQLAYIKKWMALSKPELEMYARLPKGAAFIGRQSQRYPSLVKVQMVSDEEVRAARAMTQQVELPKPRLAPAITTSSDLQQGPHQSEVRPASTKSVTSPKVYAESSIDSQLTPQEAKILRVLAYGPITMERLRAKLQGVNYRDLLRILQDLEGEGLIQAQRVSNVQGKSSVFYASLQAEWLQSESLEHRAMLDMVEEALLLLRPIRYGPTHPNYPDLALEKSTPPTCIELETARKKLTAPQLLEWARGVKERNSRLGYARVVVIVPNVAVQRRYAEACTKHDLGLVTMANVLPHFDIGKSEAALWKIVSGHSETA